MKKALITSSLHCLIFLLLCFNAFAGWNQGGLESIKANNFSISHDRKFLAALGESGSIRVFNLQSRNLEYVLQDLEVDSINEISKTGIAFSKDDKYIYTGNYNKWDVENRRLDRKIFRGLESTQIETSPDGHYLAGRVDRDYNERNIIYLVNLDNDDTARINAESVVNDIRFTKDSKTLIYSCLNGKFYFINIADKKVNKEIVFYNFMACCTFSLSNNDRYALVYDRYRDTNFLIDFKENNIIRAWKGRAPLQSFFSSDDQSFVLPGDSAVEYRKTSDGSLIKAIKLDRPYPDGVLYINNSSLLIVYRNAFEILDLNDNRAYPLTWHNATAGSLLFADENYLVSAENGFDNQLVQMFDCKNRRLIWRRDTSGMGPIKVTISNDKKLLAICQSYISVLETQTGINTFRKFGFYGQIDWGCISPDNKNIAIINCGNNIETYNLQNPMILDRYVIDAPVKKIFYNPAGDSLFLIRNQGKARFLTISLEDKWVGETPLWFSFLDRNINQYRFSRDNRLFALVHDTTLQVFDLVKMEMIQSITLERKNLPFSLNISKDNKYVAATILDTVRIWDIGTGTRVMDIYDFPAISQANPEGGFYRAECYDVDFSDDGKKIAFSNAAGVFIRDIVLAGTEEKPQNPSADFSISPNPSSNVARLGFQMEEAGYVRAAMYSYSGLLVKDFGRVYCDKGDNSMVIDNNHCPAGLYFIELSRFGRKSVRAMMVLQI